MAKITTSFRIEKDIFQRGRIRAIEKGVTFSRYVQDLVDREDRKLLKKAE